MELNDNLKQYSNCTQQVLSLTQLKGECLVYKKNINTSSTTSLIVDKQADALIKTIENRDKQVLSEGEKKEKCYEQLKKLDEELRQLKVHTQELASDKELLNTKYAKCSDVLSKCTCPE